MDCVNDEVIMNVFSIAVRCDEYAVAWPRALLATAKLWNDGRKDFTLAPLCRDARDGKTEVLRTRFFASYTALPSLSSAEFCFSFFVQCDVKLFLFQICVVFNVWIFCECKNKERRAPTHTFTATKQSERLTFAEAGCTCLYVYKYASLYLWCSSTYIYLILGLSKTLVYLF